MIVITDEMVQQFGVGWDLNRGTATKWESWRAGLAAALESLEPEAKRELAAQLLRAANTDEGYHDTTTSERIDR